MHHSTRVFCAGALAALACYFLIWPIWRAQFPIEIWFTESWNAFHQDAAAAGLALYPGAGDLTVNNYPPLSFYAIGGLGKLFGDPLYIGRVLSFVGLAALAVEIALIVRTLAGSLFAGAVGALWFVALMAHNATHYLGANDPQIAGHAIMGAGFAWFLVRPDRPLLPLLVMVLAGFWKHNIIVMPATVTIWLLMHRQWRPVLLSACAAAAGLVACGMIFGAAFYANLLTSRAYSVGHLVSQLGSLQWLIVAFGIWAVWAWYRRDRFTTLYVAIGFASCLLQWLGDGVFGNAAFDLMIALAVGVGCAFASPIKSRLGADRSRVLLVVLLSLRLVASGRHESASVMFDPQFRASYITTAEAMTAAAARVARLPGPVYCVQNNLVCRDAGKAFVVDDFKTDQLLATGKVNAAEIDAMLHERGITVLDQP